MRPSIAERQQELATLCRGFGLVRLKVFGTAARNGGIVTVAPVLEGGKGRIAALIDREAEPTRRAAGQPRYPIEIRSVAVDPTRKNGNMSAWRETM